MDFLGCCWSPVTLGFSQNGFIGFCDVLVERPELQDGFPFVNMSGRPVVEQGSSQQTIGFVRVGWGAVVKRFLCGDQAIAN